MPDPATGPDASGGSPAGEGGSPAGEGGFPAGAGGGPAGEGGAPAGAAGAAGSGLDENVAGALSYLLGPVTGILFLLLDRERPFVRFHAAQCLVLVVAGVALSVGLMVLQAILGMIPLLGLIVNILLSAAIGFGGFLLWLFLMYKAFQGEEWEIPVLGEYARKLAAEI